MGINLMREARVRIEKINPRAVEGGNILVSEFVKGSFIAGLRDDRIKYIVKAKGEEESLAQLVETALQEGEIKSQRFKGNLTLTSPGYSGNFIREQRPREHRPQIKKEVFIASGKNYNHQRTGEITNNYGKRQVCERCHKVGHHENKCRERNLQGNW
jgi:hypothetical protein